MSAKLEDIKAVNWQLSAKNYGEVVQGIEDVRQCIQVILTTTKGSDPLRPDFGSNIWQHIDKPVNIAAALITAEIIDCIGKWEGRVIIKKIIYAIEGSTINFSLYLELLQSGSVSEIAFYIDTRFPASAVNGSFSHGFNFGFDI